MRLRRETGDFSLSFTENVTSKTIAKGLGAEDLIGVIVEVDGAYSVATAAAVNDGTIELTCGDNTVKYVPATGVATYVPATNDAGND